MKKDEKNELAYYVKQHIRDGHNMDYTVNSLIRYGFKKSTIKRYYKTFQGVIDS